MSSICYNVNITKNYTVLWENLFSVTLEKSSLDSGRFGYAMKQSVQKPTSKSSMHPQTISTKYKASKDKTRSKGSQQVSFKFM